MTHYNPVLPAGSEMRGDQSWLRQNVIIQKQIVLAVGVSSAQITRG